MAQDKNKDEATKSNDFSGSSSSSSQGAQTGTLASGRDRVASRGQSGERGQETDFSGQERRPRYGYYYATAVQRISTRRRPSDEQSGRRTQGDQGVYGQRSAGGKGYSGQAPYGLGGSGQGSAGQGGYGQSQSGPYGSQFIRGTGGQTNPQSEFGGSSYGAADYGSSETGLGYDEQLRGFQDRKSIGGERSDRSREGRGTVERGSEGSDSSERSRVEPGSFGGRSQVTRSEEEQGGYGESRAGVFDREREQGGGPGERDWRTQDRERGEGRRGHWQREPFTAGEIMTRSVKAVTKQSTLQNVAEIMKDENCGIVPIVDEGHRLLGVVTDRDLVIRTLAEGKSPSEVKVEDVMTDDLEVVTPDEELREVVELMGKKQVRRIPVVDKDDRLVGIIAMADIANRADYDEDLQEALEGISSKRSFWNRLWS